MMEGITRRTVIRSSGALLPFLSMYPMSIGQGQQAQAPTSSATKTLPPPSADLIDYISDGISQFRAREIQGTLTKKDYVSSAQKLNFLARHLDQTGLNAGLMKLASDPSFRTTSGIRITGDVSEHAFLEVKKYMPSLSREQYGVEPAETWYSADEVNSALDRIALKGISNRYRIIADNLLITGHSTSAMLPAAFREHATSLNDGVYRLEKPMYAKKICAPKNSKKDPKTCASTANDIRIYLEWATAIGCAVVGGAVAPSVGGLVATAIVCASIAASIEKLDDKLKAKCDQQS